MRRTIGVAIGMVLCFAAAMALTACWKNPVLFSGMRPAVAPNGRQIVLVGIQEGAARLFLIDVTGGAPLPITKMEGDCYEPCFSPDGTSIAFVQRLENNRGSVCMMTLATQSMRKLTVSQGDESFPVFSNDGKKILFARAAYLGQGGIGGTRWRDWDVYEIEIATGKEQRLTHESYYHINSLSLSPTGQYFAFCSASRIYLGSFPIAHVPKAITAEGSVFESPSWTKDGQGLLCSAVLERDKPGLFEYSIIRIGLDGIPAETLYANGSMICYPMVMSSEQDVLFLESHNRRTFTLKIRDTSTGKIKEVSIGNEITLEE